MQIFEMRTGKFTPLNDAQIASFTEEQRLAYFELAAEVAKLDSANSEAADAIDANRAAVARLHEAEIAESKKPKQTFLDEHRRAMAQWRADHP